MAVRAPILNPPGRRIPCVAPALDSKSGLWFNPPDTAMQRGWNSGWLLCRDGPLDRPTAWVCLLTNVFVTPGLGSILAGRVWSGAVQLASALAGFGLVLAWFFNLFRVLHSGLDPAEGLPRYAWQGKVGLLLFFAGWFLALISSVSIVRGAQPRERPKTPPRL